MSEPTSSVIVHDQRARWIGIAVWFGLLVALGCTSYIAALTFSENHLYFNLLAFSVQENGLSISTDGANRDRGIAVMSIAIECAIVICLIVAWLRFVLFSRNMVLSLAWLEQQEKETTLFSDMLIAEGGENTATDRSEPDTYNTEQTTMSEVLRFLAYSWGCLLAWNPILLLVNMLG